MSLSRVTFAKIDAAAIDAIFASPFTIALEKPISFFGILIFPKIYNLYYVLNLRMTIRLV